MQNLNEVALEGTKTSITIEQTNNTNDMQMLSSTATRLFNNYTSTVGADDIKMKKILDDIYNKNNMDIDGIMTTYSEEIDNKCGETTTSITNHTNNLISQLNASSNKVQTAIVTMANAIPDNSLIEVVSDSVVAVKDSNGMIVHNEVALYEDILLPIPDDAIFAVNYAYGDISSCIGDNTPMGIESVFGYEGDGVFDNSDGSLSGQMIPCKGCWFGVGTTNLIGKYSYNGADCALLNYAQYIKNTNNIEAMDYIASGVTLSNLDYVTYSFINSQNFVNQGRIYDTYFGFEQSSCYPEAGGRYINVTIYGTQHTTLLNDNRIKIDATTVTHKLKDKNNIITYIRHDVDTVYSSREIIKPQLECLPFHTPFVKNKRKDTKIIYRTMEVLR